MKKVYKIISTTEYMGPFETEDDFPVELPYTDQTIPKGILQPSFDFIKNEWVDLTPPILKEELLNAKKIIEQQAQETTDAQLAIAELYEMMGGGTTE
ncbi:hypothetical protein [Enterococcus faecalis]|uniref:hypothetical protein n=1 Tax=Enterococcus faecalis TaxID=1351 RepID=UPI004043307E